ncbi:MAG TPA: RagB/SusD family nutrient uptake outer membrane protein [Chitinophagaceae bacterium]|nr:RagB/SusD family nutrient uptake outer membrane protein [Chitinophagaceae bacterium]
MKIISGYAILFILVIGVGCKKWVKETPLSDGTLDGFFKSKYDADAAMAGMYGQFQQMMYGESQFNNRYTFWGDARSDHMERQAQYSNGSTTEIHYNSLTANNSFADWTPLYVTIGRTNINIAKFPLINTIAPPAEQLTLATLNSYMAQCYAMRAICYFYIARVWGDAPIRTTPYNAGDVEGPRKPVAMVYEQVITDLTTAYNLTVKGATPTVWYIGEGAIASILADVYMWKKDYDNAIVWFKNIWKAKSPTGTTYNAAGITVTGAGGAAADLEVTGNWKTIFTNPASVKETIWTLHWDVTANGCPCMSGISSAVNNTPMRTYEFLFKGPYLGNWIKSTTDVRPKQTIDVTKTDNWDRLLKWYGPSGFTNAATNYLTSTQAAAAVGTDKTVYLPMYRLADMYLLYAEALNKKGDRANALKYLNVIHQRAGNTAYTLAQTNTEGMMEDTILVERQKELFAEGKRWFDLVRTDHVLQIMDPILKQRQNLAGADTLGFGTDKRKYLWPLHRNVLNANSQLVQNPPYGG